MTTSISAASSALRFDVQRQTNDPSIVRWGTREFRLELIQISAEGTEATVPLTQQDLATLIPKIEQALVKMQRANIDPVQIRQVDLVWKGKLEKGKITSYTYEETVYVRNQEQVRQKVPLVINGVVERSFPELKFIDDYFSERLTGSSRA